MQREDELVRKLMLELERASQAINQEFPVAGYTRDQVAYHLALIVKSGFAEGPKPMYPNTGADPTIPAVVIALRLTPSGHDFIATLRDDSVWVTVKERAASVAGGVSLEILKQLGVAVVKQRLGLA